MCLVFLDPKDLQILDDLKTMRKLVLIRCVPLALVVALTILFVLNIAVLQGNREHRTLTDPLVKILEHDKVLKEKRCQDYFAHLASSLERDALLENSTPRKQWIRTFVGHLRAYGACFLESNVEVKDGIEDVERKLFPLFSGEMPVVTKWDGTVVPAPKTKETSYWGRMKNGFSKKGIVLSMSDAGVEEAKRLLRVLRLLENDLSIQMVHKGDLSPDSIEKLVEVARAEVDFEYARSSLYPPQDVYFVDASGSLADGASKYFRRFSNKWIAALFSTFDEMVLMDTDVVPFVKPRALFSYREYLKHGAYFFRDRFTSERTWTTPMGFFRSLHPSLEEQRAFDIHDYTDVAEATGFFQSKSKHVMESGMVVMKRSTHLTGMLISTALQFWHETSGPFYGDKELFWLGQIYAGQALFTFNEQPAAGIGELQETKKSWEVCSTQPAHFDAEHRLLWINGGLQKCKKGYYQKDFEALRSLREKYKTPEALHDHYRSPSKINGAIIPKLKLGFVQDKTKGCIGYVWCASVPKNEESNAVVRFSQEQTALIEHIEQLWYGDDYKKYL